MILTDKCKGKGKSSPLKCRWRHRRGSTVYLCLTSALDGVVNITPRPLYPQEIYAWPIVQENECGKWHSRRASKRPSRSVLLYRLLCPDTWYWQGKTELLKENCPTASLSATNPTWTGLGSNPGLCGEGPVTNGLSHGTGVLVRRYRRFGSISFFLMSVLILSVLPSRPFSRGLCSPNLVYKITINMALSVVKYHAVKAYSGL